MVPLPRVASLAVRGRLRASSRQSDEGARFRQLAISGLYEMLDANVMVTGIAMSGMDLRAADSSTGRVLEK